MKYQILRNRQSQFQLCYLLVLLHLNSNWFLQLQKLEAAELLMFQKVVGLMQQEFRIQIEMWKQ